MFSEAQRDEMKTIARGTWSLALLFWLCGFKDEAASPSSAVVFALPGELPSPCQIHSFSFSSFSQVSVSSTMIFGGSRV
jgi:hypothetical protein